MSPLCGECEGGVEAVLVPLCGIRKAGRMRCGADRSSSGLLRKTGEFGLRVESISH